jgi:hypothetical protein
VLKIGRATTQVEVVWEKERDFNDAGSTGTVEGDESTSAHK